MELEDAIKMVWLRGNLMHNAVPEGRWYGRCTWSFWRSGK